MTFNLHGVWVKSKYYNLYNLHTLLGVVGAEVIASERGLGQQLAYLGSTFNVNGVWSLLFDLALIGVLIMKLMNWIERRLLHWQ